MEYENNRNISRVDSNKNVNLTGMNVTMVEIPQNNEILLVDTEPSEQPIKEEFIEDTNPDVLIPLLPPISQPEEASTIIPKIEPTMPQIKMGEVTIEKVTD